jgi:hypothetical protein
MNEIGTVSAIPWASTGMARMEGSRKENIMAHFNAHAVKSYALAAFASLYASVMLLAIVGQNGAQVGSLIV